MDVCLYANIRIFKVFGMLMEYFQDVCLYANIRIFKRNARIVVRKYDVCLYANIRIFKQITTPAPSAGSAPPMFVSMQIYEFLSKSQHCINGLQNYSDVCLYANIRIFKQITTRLLP